jgi:hypothetical protein
MAVADALEGAGWRRDCATDDLLPAWWTRGGRGGVQVLSFKRSYRRNRLLVDAPDRPSGRPLSLAPGWIGSEPPEATDLTALAEIVFDCSLSAGIRMRACRDRMLVWHCSEWSEKPFAESPGGDVDTNAGIAHQIKCARLMNVHLACLQQADPLSRATRIVTPKHLIDVGFDEVQPQTASATEPLGYYLSMARDKRDSVPADWRGRRAHTVELSSLEKSTALLDRLLSLPASEIAMFRAESLYRAAAAFDAFDDGTALIHAWIAIEGLLSDRLKEYLDGEEDRGADEDTFIPYDRRRYLEGSWLTAGRPPRSCLSWTAFPTTPTGT